MGDEEITVTGQEVVDSEDKPITTVKKNDVIKIINLYGDNDQQLYISGGMDGYSVFHISW